ncbi:hypothetical protein [Streptomyces noursei]|uniref:hypothetical protein n=1 Tax=Streptomyces noursei TaxID=1971 RepID=UPI0016720C30|nr:hypothetical protein [Streptomyces noursei]MCZ1013993.1 hypothetical protein [Streptomyces noursei]GGX40318.1 hypothetical protein GCM10010341_72770 [Streptomyces noursei]
MSDFPDDLVQLQRNLRQADADLRAFLNEHPHAPEPVDGWHDKPGEGHWHERRQDPSPGWTDDEKQTEVELRKVLLDAIQQVHAHPHWNTLTGPDLVKARMRLKHADDPAEG